MKKLITLLMLCFMGGSLLHSQLLIENFDYTATPADSLNAYGWVTHSGTSTNYIMVTSPGLTYSGYVGSGIGNAATLKASGQDVNKTFSPITAGSVYTAFMVNVDSAKTSGTADYFFHISSSPLNTSYQLGRVFVRKNATNKLAFGISYVGNAASAVYTDTLYDLNTTYLFVLKCEFGQNPKLFINPAINVTEPAPTITSTDFTSNPTNYGCVALRQGTQGNGIGVKIDGIRVTTSWSSVLGFVVNDPPVVNSVAALTANTVRIVFNEPVDTSAENVLHYAGLPAIGSAVRSASFDTVTLNLASSLTLGRTYTLTVASIRDTAGAAMSTPTNHTVLFNNTTGNLVINEMMYNNPGVDSLEFIEFYNADNVAIPLGGLQFTAGLTGTLPDTVLDPGEYFVIAGSHVGFNSIFGFTPIRWVQGQNLNNTGELIELRNTVGNVVDSVRYKDVYPWPAGPAGNGYSLSLVDPLSDNSDGLNWKASGTRQQPFSGAAIWATPGQMNFVTIPNLIEPADGIYFTTSPGTEDNMTFRWNNSIVPVGGTVYYIVELVDALSNSFNTIYEGTDTTYDYSLANFDDWLASNGWPVNDTAYGITWRVTANDSTNEFISNGFEMFPMRENLAPTAFDLLVPADGLRWEVGMSSTDSITWKWTRSVDPEGMPVYYSIEYDTTADMNSAFHGYYFIGTDTFYVDYASIEAEFLNSLGVDSLTTYWRIVATDSVNDYVSSNQLWSIKYVLIPEPVTPFRANLSGYQVVPPTNSQFAGWGYFEMNADSTSLFYRIYIPDGVSPVTIRNNWAGSGSDEPVLYEYNLVGDSAVGTQVIPIDIARELCAGRLYVMHPGVGIRGQIYKGTTSVSLPPASNLNAIEFEESIELDWSAPLTLLDKSGKTYRYSDKQFSRRIKNADNTKSIQAPPLPGLLIGYNVYRSGDGLGFIKIAQTDSLYYIDNDVTAGNNYWYFVSAVYLEGQASWTDTIEASPVLPFAFIEGFNDTSMTVPGTLPEGWSKLDADGGDEDPFTGEWRVVPDLDIDFTTYEGAGMMLNTYEAANSSGLIDEWLITPHLVSSAAEPRLSLYARASADSWPDSLQILISTTNSDLNSFTAIDYFEGPADWTEYNYDLSTFGITAGDSFYVAFRYLIYDGGSMGSNSDFIMMDYVRIDGNPIVIGVDDPIAVTPKQFDLFQNFPNPFNPSTSIRYDLKDNAKVTLKIYNTLGQEVRTLVNSEQTAGQYTMQWDGRNNAGLSVSSGVYIYRIQAGDFVKSRKMMFIK